jgi:S-formylglutathione hydrolase FrmB
MQSLPARRSLRVVRAMVLIALFASSVALLPTGVVLHAAAAAQARAAAPSATPPASTVASAGASTGAGTVERIKVHGVSLEGSLLGDAADREVAVFLPPSYTASPTRRDPVVYMLHGFTDDVAHWWGFEKHFVSVPLAMNKTLAAGTAAEMILVMPNAYTRYQGSFYSSSPATGDWETFVASELVAYIDAHYRTIANVNSRGLFGHSMGGYGAVRIGMRHPDVFSSVYAMSACCLMPPRPITDPARLATAEAIKDPDEVAKADFGTKAVFSQAAAWSPNPQNAPLFIDLPTKDGQVRPEIAAKWAANAPIAMLDQYIGNLKRLKAFAFDVGTKDGLAPHALRLHEVLDTYKLPHVYETYDGDHLNRIEERLQSKVFPFFAANLTTR